MARKVSIEILGDSASAERAFARTSRAARGFNHDVTSASKGAIAATIGFKGLGRSLAFASTSFLGGVGIAAAAKAFVNAATQIQEETEKTGVVFGQNAKQVQAWAGTLAQSFGIGEGSALKAAGVFGNMFRSLHLGAPEAARMSERLVQLAADMASFNNASPEDTLAALQSGLAGQVRPLRQFGVFLSQDRLKATAYADGIAKVGSKLNATQKVQAAYNIILKDTSIQQGDVARNTQSLSVAQSKLHAQLEDSEALIGTALLPTEVKLTNELAVYLDRLNKSGKLQKVATETAAGLTRGLHDVAAVASIVKRSFEVVDKVTGSLENTLRDAAGVWLLFKSRALAVRWGLIAASERAVGTAAATSALEVGGLAGALGRLAAIDPIVIPITLLISDKHVRDSGSSFLKDATNGAGLTKTLKDDLNFINSFFQSTGGKLLIPFGGSTVGGRSRGSGGPTSAFTGGQNAFAPGGSLNAASILTQTQAAANKTVAATIKGAAKKHLSLLGQFNLLELKLADAQRQGNTVLQKSVLVSEEGILLKLRDQAKTLAKRTGFAQQAASIEDQIRAIDASNAADAKKAAAAAKKAKKASGDFQVPLILQVAQARAEALGLTGKEHRILLKMKKFAEAAIKSGKLGLEGTLEAWQSIADINNQLGEGAKKELTSFKHVSTSKILAGLGLTGDELRKARVRIAMLGPGATVPPHHSPAFAGAAAGPRGPGGTRDRTLSVVMHNPTFNGIHNVRQFEDELNKRARSRPARRRGG